MLDKYRYLPFASRGYLLNMFHKQLESPKTKLKILSNILIHAIYGIHHRYNIIKTNFKQK